MKKLLTALFIYFRNIYKTQTTEVKMTPIENYSKLIDNIFGPGTTTFSLTSTHTNSVIGALNNPKDFFEFKANFIARLNRLNNIYSTHPAYLKEIIVQVNEIASQKNWEGAFAELAAFDHLNQDILGHKTSIHNPIRPNITLLNTLSFAAELGKHETNLDGYVEDRNLYFDVKCFKDNVKEILNGIYNDLRKHIGSNDIMITEEHALDTSYEDYQVKRKQLLEELKANVTLAAKPTYLRSSVIPNLTFRFMWGSGILTSEKTYHPYIHAQNFHKSVFNYANKFMKEKPTVIVLVVFPWYNNVVTDFSNSNKELYRALSRRVFCQYKFNPTLFNAFNSKFRGGQTIYEISNHLSGIIFLEDNTILSHEPNKTNVNSYVYFNPNAKKRLINSLAHDYLISLNNTYFDDFEYDNY